MCYGLVFLAVIAITQISSGYSDQSQSEDDKTSFNQRSRRASLDTPWRRMGGLNMLRLGKRASEDRPVYFSEPVPSLRHLNRARRSTDLTEASDEEAADGNRVQTLPFRLPRYLLRGEPQFSTAAGDISRFSSLGSNRQFGDDDEDNASSKTFRPRTNKFQDYDDIRNIAQLIQGRDFDDEERRLYLSLLRLENDNEDNLAGGLTRLPGFEDDRERLEKRQLPMLRLGKRALGMLRLGRRSNSGEIKEDKRALAMLRLGKRSEE